MNPFKNKHILLAAVVAPVLGLLTYYAIGVLTGEEPQAAEQGRSYPLVALPNCRRGGGQCELKNGDFALDLRTEPFESDRFLLSLESVFPLQGVVVSLAGDEAGNTEPLDMRPQGDSGQNWVLVVPRPESGRDRLRLVASANQSLYFGEFSNQFMNE